MAIIKKADCQLCSIKYRKKLLMYLFESSKVYITRHFQKGIILTKEGNVIVDLFQFLNL